MTANGNDRPIPNVSCLDDVMNRNSWAGRLIASARAPSTLPMLIFFFYYLIFPLRRKKEDAAAISGWTDAAAHPEKVY